MAIEDYGDNGLYISIGINTTNIKVFPKDGLLNLWNPKDGPDHKTHVQLKFNTVDSTIKLKEYLTRIELAMNGTEKEDII